MARWKRNQDGSCRRREKITVNVESDVHIGKAPIFREQVPGSKLKKIVNGSIPVEAKVRVTFEMGSATIVHANRDTCQCETEENAKIMADELIKIMVKDIMTKYFKTED
jgi:hypothetical protein